LQVEKKLMPEGLLLVYVPNSAALQV